MTKDKKIDKLPVDRDTFKMMRKIHGMSELYIPAIHPKPFDLYDQLQKASMRKVKKDEHD